MGVSYDEKINMDVDASPTKGFLIEGKDDPDMAIHWKLSFGKRPADELCDLRIDPVQLHNVAESGEHADTLKGSKEKLFSQKLARRQFSKGRAQCDLLDSPH